MLTVVTQIAREDDLEVFSRLLDSVSFADKLIIYNLERHDDMAQALFQKYHAQVITVPTPKVIEEIRQQQVMDAGGDWVLVMDYDEVVPPALAQEILAICHVPKPIYHAYTIPRLNYSLGYPLQYGGFGRDYVHRLFYRPSFLSWPKNIHSTPTFQGNLGTLNSTMEHHKDASLAQMVEKTNRYSQVEAEQFFVGGLAPVTTFTLLRKLKMEFIRRYLLKLALLDGPIGLIQSIYQAFSVFISYAKLYEKQLTKTHNNRILN